jgi:LacI family transcriptional regulator
MTDDNTKSATISDVARLAGVSMKTVSRVFNNEKYVSKEKKEKILQVAEELNYRPSLQARGLAGSKSHIIGFLVDKFEGDYLAKVLRGLLDKSETAGCQLVVEALHDKGRESRLRRILNSMKLDGVVLASPICDDVVLLDILAKAKVPTVRIGPGFDYEGTYKVSIDDFEAAYQMTEYIISCGHKRIGFIKGDPQHGCALERERGYVRALQVHGLPIENGLFAPGQFNFESGRQAANLLLDAPNPPTAIFASNDDMATGVLAAARERGLQVPDDLSIVGFDDAFASTVVSPALTTVHQPVTKMASDAFDLLTRQEKAVGADTDTEFMPHPFALCLRDSVSSRA